jgi:hypothetical protein
MTLLDNFPHRCRIQHLVTSKGSLGGSRTAPVTVRSNVRCWEQKASHAEIADYEKRGMRVSRRVYFTSDPGVTERNEIVVTSRMVNGAWANVASPEALMVRSVEDPDATAGLGVCWKVMCDKTSSDDD